MSGWDWMSPNACTSQGDDPIPRRSLSSPLRGGGRPRVSCVLWCAAGRSAAGWCTCAPRAIGVGGIATPRARGRAAKPVSGGLGGRMPPVQRAVRTGACGSVAAGPGVAGMRCRRHCGMSRISLPLRRRRGQSGVRPARMGWLGWPGDRAEPGVAVVAAVGRWCGPEPRSGDSGGLRRP